MPDERQSDSKPATHHLVERVRQARMGRAPRWRTAEHHASYFLPYLR